MAYQLNFAHLALYDPGIPGITVAVTLKLIDRFAYIDARVDTGATECIFARRYGEQLGLNIENGEPLRIGTVTGTFKVYRHEVTMEISDYTFDVRVCFAADEGFNRNVLGRHGFLDRVKLGIIDYEGKLYLSSYND
ncbi:MAG: retroviral-like aspartic protease family protein [Blastocatellia bacterium]|nr:retroviral-like aspartic protease family protein [Blastocatellia bacterium]